MNTSLELARARRLPIGAECSPEQGLVHFRVWAADHNSVSVVLEGENGEIERECKLDREEKGYFSGTCEANAGALYRFRLSGREQTFPDPASRAQPKGPHGPSQIIDPRTFVWSDAAWRGPDVERQVLYEMHVGTFTPDGTWAGAATQLQRLKDLGVTTIEMMPVAEFPGRFGWGYDGVNLFAPYHHYGAPDDLRRFVDAAHRVELAVILDVVYNHVGPDGNYLREFTGRYFSERYKNEWGDPINFDDDAAAVREWVTSNAAYWIDEFHFDGLRLDATQQIFDASARNILTEVSEAARRAAGSRRVFVVAENEPQCARLVRPESGGGYGLDALWSEDFHHSAVVALDGRREAYYTDYEGSAQEFVSLAKWGVLYQGQHYSWQNMRRGEPAFDVPPTQFVTFLENHDQVANAPSLDGRRLCEMVDPAIYRAITAYWLLLPGLPMFFQGQEFGAATPFLYFADHGGDLAAAIQRGRATFMSQFPSAASRDLERDLPLASSPDTRQRCVIDPSEANRDSAILRLHRDLLRLRRSEPSVSGPGHFIEGTVLRRDAFALRFFAADPRAAGSSPEDRLLIVNLGARRVLRTLPHPLLAPPNEQGWAVRWSSDDPVYGGAGTPEIEKKRGWQLPAHTTVLLAPKSAS